MKAICIFGGKGGKDTRDVLFIFVYYFPAKFDDFFKHAGAAI